MTKHDPNYIAGVEKAVAEKYGKETVQDFRSEWAPAKEIKYLGQLKERNQKTDYLHRPKHTTEVGGILIKKREKGKKDTRSCPVCKTYSFSLSDDLYMNRFKCCKYCYFDFVELNEKKWEGGWKPSKGQVESSLRRRK